MCWNHHEKEDAQQEIAIKLLNRPELTIREPERYRQRSIRYHLCTMSRRDSRRRGAEQEYARRQVDTKHVRLDEPAMLCETSDRARLIRRCVAKLPPRQHEAIEAVYLQELTIPQACIHLGLSPAALNSALYYGRVRLRQALNREELMS